MSVARLYYVSNVVDANRRAAESEKAVGAVINIANGQRVTLNELFEKMKSVTGNSSSQVRYEPTRAGDVRDSLADLTLARTLLGYDPKVGLEDGLRMTLDWWKSKR